jgi:hypothetical protein
MNIKAIFINVCEDVCLCGSLWHFVTVSPGDNLWRLTSLSGIGDLCTEQIARSVDIIHNLTGYDAATVLL